MPANRKLSVAILLAGVCVLSTAAIISKAEATNKDEAKYGTVQVSNDDAKHTNVRANESDVQPKPTGQLTYAHDIAPIMINRCANCHQPGGIAPFSLLTYADLKKRTRTVEDVVTSKYMPPWKPSVGFGEFINERCMSAAEIASIKEWIKQGAVAGDLSKVPEVPASLLQAGTTWKHGTPDLIVKMPEPYKVKAEGPDVYRCFVFPLNSPAAKFVTNVEFHPGNAKVLHHSLFFLDNTGTARKKDEADPEMGFSSFGGPGFLPTGSLGGWAPGNSMLPLPDGVARLVRPNSDLVMQMHFHPDGKEESAQAELGIYFSKKTPKTLLLPLTLRSRKIDIPADEKSYTVSGTTTVPADFDLLQVTPHAHLLCKEIKCEATTPDGKHIPLIWIKNWDFNWQEQYGYNAPIHLPEGTVVSAQWTYDNSADNFRNPNHPPKRVTWGEQTTDEMALIFFGGIVSKNEEMGKYMRGMIMNGLRKSPELALKPAVALKAAKMFLSPKNSPLNLLKQDREAGGTGGGLCSEAARPTPALPGVQPTPTKKTP